LPPSCCSALMLRTAGLWELLAFMCLEMCCSSRKRDSFMAFNIDNYVKLPPWLQFVGYMLIAGGLIFLSHKFGLLVAYLGLGISFAGFCYDLIYP